MKDKILVIAGPTSSGKSELAVRLAKKYGGEIISCDSRQIYRGMNLGTGKIPGKWFMSPSPLARGDVPKGQRGRTNDKKKFFVYKSIIHHLIDFVNPKKQYSVSLFQKQAQKAIADVIARGKLPILCGGTAHWIDAVVYNQKLPDVKPNAKLRKNLEKKSADDLYRQLKKLDPARAKSIDPYNKRRLIRALEIVLVSGKPVPPLRVIPETTSGARAVRNLKHGPRSKSGMASFDVTWLGLNPPRTELYKKIDKRLRQRLKAGMAKEIQQLHTSGVPLLPWRGEMSPFGRQRGRTAGLSWRRLESFGLEYKYIALYLQKKLTYQQMVSQLSYAIKHYAKKQMTWWKRNKNIKWIKSTGVLTRDEILI